MNMRGPGLCGKHCVPKKLPFSPLQVERVQDSAREKLLQVQQGEADHLAEKDRNELKKRKLLAEV